MLLLIGEKGRVQKRELNHHQILYQILHSPMLRDLRPLTLSGNKQQTTTLKHDFVVNVFFKATAYCKYKPPCWMPLSLSLICFPLRESCASLTAAIINFTARSTKLFQTTVHFTR